VTENKYEIAWRKLRMHIEGLPFMLDLIPIPPEALAQVEGLEPRRIIDTTSRILFKQVLGLMEEQEHELGIPREGIYDSQTKKFLDILAKASPTDTLQDLIKAVHKINFEPSDIPIQPQYGEAPDFEAYANTTSAKEREKDLLPITSEAARLNYDNASALGSTRALVVVPAADGYPVLGCLFVAGENELVQVANYAQSGHKMVYDSRRNTEQGEN
jgi:hypothetical protein